MKKTTSANLATREKDANQDVQATRKIYYYAHTHWDREWHQPFESFRIQLLSVVRQILGQLVTGELESFYLDGQSIILEDLTAIDAEIGSAIRAAMASGKLSLGPWYVLCDQALVSGESLIRNLKVGLAVAAEYGTPARVGYCPDTFGHAGDLPRILRGFGINNACVWRGVPQLQSGPAFWWVSPDQSRVLAYHLTNGYYLTAFSSVNDVLNGGGAGGSQSIIEILHKWVTSPVNGCGAAGDSGGQAGGQSASGPGPYLPAINGALLPVGGDHICPPRDLSDLTHSLNKTLAKQDAGMELVAVRLPQFLAMVEKKIAEKKLPLQRIEGELRDNRAAASYERAYLLPGVLSTRLYLKRANRLAEQRLSRVVEPLAALLSVNGLLRYPDKEILHAWKILLQNQPHDSICGCSVDAVHRQMESRYEACQQVLTTLETRAELALSGYQSGATVQPLDPDFGCNRLLIFNLTGSETASPVYLRWAQQVGSPEPPRALVQVEKSWWEDHLFYGYGSVPYYRPVQMYEGWVQPGSAVPALGYGMSVWPPAPSDAAAVTPMATAATAVDDAADHGGDGNKRPVTEALPLLQSASARSFKRTVSNGLLTVSIVDGTELQVTSVGDGKNETAWKLRHRIVDRGDGGDTYNFDPIPGDKPLQARLTAVSPGKQGPLVASLILEYTLAVPDGLEKTGVHTAGDEDLGKLEIWRRQRKTQELKLVTEVILKRGVPIVFFESKFHNTTGDHRLEVHLDTGRLVYETQAESHFSLVRRFHNLKVAADTLPVAKGTEAALDRWPAQRFVIANGQVVFNTGLPEYGVEGASVALTLLRAVSQLSRSRLWTRGGGAGPSVAVPEANCLRQLECSYGWAPLVMPPVPGSGPGSVPGALPGPSSPNPLVNAYRLAELYEGSLWACLVRRDGDESPEPAATYLRLGHDGARPVSMYCDPSEQAFFVRILNVSGSDIVCPLEPMFQYMRLDECRLDGEELAEIVPHKHGLDLSLRANEMKTLRFQFSGAGRSRKQAAAVKTNKKSGALSKKVAQSYRKPLAEEEETAASKPATSKSETNRPATSKPDKGQKKGKTQSPLEAKIRLRSSVSKQEKRPTANQKQGKLGGVAGKGGKAGKAGDKANRRSKHERKGTRNK